MIFSITGKCNYNCLHCSVNAPEAPLGEFSFERIEELLDEMKDCGLKNIVLIGGEPLVRRDFMQIVDAILQRGMFVVQIFTNGSLVNDALLDELDKRNISPTFMISFDGVGYHDIMRGVADCVPSCRKRPVERQEICSAMIRRCAISLSTVSLRSSGKRYGEARQSGLRICRCWKSS